MINILIVAKGNNSQVLSDFFSPEKGFKVIGRAQDSNGAKYFLGSHKKVFTVFDYSNEMENVFKELLREVQKNNAKLIVICDTVKQGFGLLEKGADDICIRPKVDSRNEWRSFFTSISAKIKKAAQDYDKEPRALKNKYTKPVESIIAIGSSTGGTECVLQILKAMPENAPPILVVQHMPPVFTALYSKRLDGECRISVWEAKDGDVLENGLALIAPGDKQMCLATKNGGYIVNCTVEEPFGGHIPAVDVLFNSVAKIAPKKAIGVILTGMGKDGAKGLLAMREGGSFTLGQNEESCIVYGMPKAAYDIGAVMRQGSPENIINAILGYI